MILEENLNIKAKEKKRIKYVKVLNFTVTFNLKHISLVVHAKKKKKSENFKPRQGKSH